MRVFAAVGTHGQQFGRLIRWLEEAVSADPSLAVLMQHGYSRPMVNAEKNVDFLSQEEFADCVAQSDVFVSQPSPGIARSVIRAGVSWVCVPRLAKYGEHVDDHQSDFAEYLDRHEIAQVAESAESLRSLLGSASTRRPAISSEALLEREERFAAAVWLAIGMRDS